MTTREDTRYVASDSPEAALRAWGGEHGSMDMGGWTERESPEAFLAAVQSESLYGGGEPLWHVDIQDVDSGETVLSVEHTGLDHLPPDLAGRLLRAWREARGLTQEEAAAAINSSRRTWQDWERAERQMPAWIGNLLRDVDNSRRGT